MNRIQLLFEFDADSNGMDRAVALIKAAENIGVKPLDVSAHEGSRGTAPASSTKPPPGGNGKAKPKPAAAAAPAAATSVKSAPTPDPTDLSDLGGGDEELGDELDDGGLGLSDDEDKNKPQPGDKSTGFKGTALEAREEALDRLRKMLASNRKADVKIVQQKMKVAKFHDVPPEQGYVFLKVVMDV